MSGLTNRAFIDSDVILDFLTDRKPFSQEASEIFTLSKLGRIILCTSPVVIANVYYILRKNNSHHFVTHQLKRLFETVTILNVNEVVIKKALDSQFSDFEDAIQNYTVEEAEIKIIITRNISDYKESAASVQLPKEFLSSFG